MVVFVKEFGSWEKAAQACAGYDSQAIIEKVYQSALKVKSGEAVYERDSVLFDRVQYSWPVLSALMWVAAQNEGRLNVIDFGGALGTSYYQNQKFLESLKDVRWNIVEQEKFVEIGKKDFENQQLKFYSDLDVCMRDTGAPVVLFSGVLQYLQNPYGILKKIKSANVKVIIFDMTPFHLGKQDRIVIQSVPRSIYKARYPSWIFSEAQFLAFFKNDSVLESFENFRGILTNDTVFKGYLIRLNH